MFAMGAETLDLPLQEKMKYEQGDDGFSFGYARLTELWRQQILTIDVATRHAALLQPTRMGHGTTLSS